jgi:hypothetical protein
MALPAPIFTQFSCKTPPSFRPLLRLSQRAELPASPKPRFTCSTIKAGEAADDGTALSSFNGASGVYYIAIVPDGNSPEYKANGNAFPIFSSFVAGQISLPVAGAGPISAYTSMGCGQKCAGWYDITLDGAQYSNIPEPASLALMGTALSALGFAYRFRRKAFSAVA